MASDQDDIHPTNGDARDSHHSKESPTAFANKEKKMKQRMSNAIKEEGEEGTHVHQEPQKSTFVDAAAMKEKVRQNLSKPKYSVMDYYHTKGIAQAIARSAVFDKMTLAVIAFNALWIAIDTDMNDSAILINADPMFIIAENAFCAYFSFEWTMRFFSFKRKRNGLRDGWFCFDSFMVGMMVLETWIFTCFLLMVPQDGEGGGGNTGIMRLARLLRLSRMARMGKLLRVMPELMIMIKGMKAAMRSVFFTLLLLVVIMYIFSIAFVQLGTETVTGEKWFPAVPMAMYNLMIYGIFLDSVGNIAVQLREEPVLFLGFMFFVLIGALTVMNMLVGVLCEVVSAVAATEQEEMLVLYVHDKLSRVMAILDSDGGGTISKQEFVQILDNVEAVRCLNDVGVDVFALIDLADYIFEDDSAASTVSLELDFGRFMEVILQLRGTNQATVKDIVDLRKFMRLSMLETYKQTTMILEKLNDLHNEGAESTKLLIAETHRGDNIRHSLIAPNGNGMHHVMSEIVPEKAAPTLKKEQFQLPSYGKSEFVIDPLPVLPKATEEGQLLKWLPVDEPMSGMMNGEPPPDDISLKGQWAPFEFDASGFPSQFKVNHESEISAAEDLARLHRMSIAQGEVIKQGIPSLSEQPYLGPGGRKYTFDQCSSTTDALHVVIPKRQIAAIGESSSDSLELEGYRRRIDAMCGQLAAIMNDAIVTAERHSDRRIAALAISKLNQPAVL